MIALGTSQPDTTSKDADKNNEVPYTNGNDVTAATNPQSNNLNQRQQQSEYNPAQHYDYDSPQRHTGYQGGQQIDEYGYAQVGSPHHYSDQSTDNESCTSDAYKRLLNRDYLSRYDSHQSPHRRISGYPGYRDENTGSEDLHTGILDFNIDFTVHVGKLAIYLKQLKLTRSHVEEYISDKKLKGKIKCILCNPAKSQKYTSGLFEATSKDRFSLQADFEDVFVYYLFPKNQVDSMSLQFKIYMKKMFRDVLIAESFLHLSEIDLKAEMLPISMPFLDISKESKEGRTRNAKRPVIVPTSAKLETLISLQYIPERSLLVVDLRQSTKLGKLCDLMNREIIVQAELISPTCECVQRKTTFLKMISDNPGCNKPLEFDLNQEQLFLYTLMLSVSYSAVRLGQQERIGWIAFGRHCSGQVEAQHWEEMLQKSCVNEAAIQWHCLCDHQEQKSSSLMKLFK